MLKCTEELYDNGVRFLIFANTERETQIYRFWYGLPERRRYFKKLISTFNNIASNPMTWSHSEKFKRLKNEDNVWEIKFHQIRLACIWDPKPSTLVIFYGFKKKQNSWTRKNIEQMRAQLAKYRYCKTDSSLLGG